MMSQIEIPALPDPFPKDHLRYKGPPLAKRAVTGIYLTRSDVSRWICGGAPNEKTKRWIAKWQTRFLRDLASHGYYSNLAENSKERLAFLYYLDVMLWDNLKDQVFEDGKEYTAYSLFVRIIHCSFSALLLKHIGCASRTRSCSIGGTSL